MRFLTVIPPFVLPFAHLPWQAAAIPPIGDEYRIALLDPYFIGDAYIPFFMLKGVEDIESPEKEPTGCETLLSGPGN
jgi:hypothetical protein